MMGTVFLINLAAEVGKYKRYDILSTILDFLRYEYIIMQAGIWERGVSGSLRTHNQLPLKKLRLLKTLKENPK